MNKHWYDFIGSDKTLNIMPWIAVLGLIAYDLLFVILVKDVNFLDATNSVSICTLGVDLLNVICIVGISMSFYSHKKNLMKTLLGAAFMSRIVYALTEFTVYTVYVKDDTALTIWATVYLVLSLMFFANHIILALGHKARTDNVIAGIGICIGIILDDLALYFVGPFDLNYAILLLLGIIVDLAIFMVILSVEVKVNEFKLIRDEKNMEASK